MGHDLYSPAVGEQIENVIRGRRIVAQFDKAVPQPSRLSLGRSGRAPEGAEIGAIGIELQHPVVELPRGFCCVIQPDEVAYVLTGFFDISRTIIVAGNLVSSNNRRRLQSVDFVKRGNPFQSGLPVRFTEKCRRRRQRRPIRWTEHEDTSYRRCLYDRL
jgi:hypothetical protein